MCCNKPSCLLGPRGEAAWAGSGLGCWLARKVQRRSACPHRSSHWKERVCCDARRGLFPHSRIEGRHERLRKQDAERGDRDPSWRGKQRSAPMRGHWLGTAAAGNASVKLAAPAASADDSSLSPAAAGRVPFHVLQLNTTPFDGTARSLHTSEAYPAVRSSNDNTLSNPVGSWRRRLSTEFERGANGDLTFNSAAL